MKIYIDVSCMLKSRQYVTGIQRVVREVAARLIDNEFDVVLLYYGDSFTGNYFQIIDNDRFVEFYTRDACDYEDMVTANFISVCEFEQNSVFFDLDSSAWFHSVNRHMLYPDLRNRNIRIVVNVYDVIPVTHPQFCSENIVFLFMEYISAVLKYADLVITNTKTVYAEIERIAERVGVVPPPNAIMPLGSDFKKVEKDKTIVRGKIKNIAAKKYILLVATIEPRKNHQMLLDAFNNALFNEGLCLVFAGRWGWRYEELQARVRSHPMLSRKFFHITDANDDEIKYLYKNAFAVACPSFEEGFGLPVIEGLLQGVPVFASDIPVFREVGGDFCEYFEPDNYESFAELVKHYFSDDAAYSALRQRVGGFVPYTWDKSRDAVAAALRSVMTKSDIVPQTPKQMVVLSARPKNLLPTVPFIEHLMPFITELLICCPQKCVDELKSGYSGRLALKFLTDEELLAGNPPPADHATRNYCLRCLAVRSRRLDDVFIMSDDDYRPLRRIEPSVFVSGGKYSAFYCYDLYEWQGDAANLSSYDISMRKSAQWLADHHMPTLQYSSHMPQVIDSRVFRQMLRDYPELPLSGLAEWCTYFNYAARNYGDILDIKPYVTLGWPGVPSEWDLYVEPTEYLFENYYEHLYEGGQIYQGLSKEWNDNIVHENITKISRYALCQAEHDRRRSLIKGYVATYNKVYREEPSIVIDCKDPKKPMIHLPVFMMLPTARGEEQWLKIPIAFAYDGETPLKCGLITYFIDEKRQILKTNHRFNFTLDKSTLDIELPMLTWNNTGRFQVMFEFSVEDYDVTESAAVTAEFVSVEHRE